MKRLILAALLAVAVLPAQGELFQSTYSALDAAVSASEVNSQTVGLYGYVESVAISITNDWSFYTASGDLLMPDVSNLQLIAHSTFNSSNAYIDRSGTYQLRYETNSEWRLSSTASGPYAGPAWANSNDVSLLSGTNFQPVGATATGTVQILSATTVCAVAVTALNLPDGSAGVTVFSKSNLTAGAFYPVRIQSGNTSGGVSNDMVRIPLGNSGKPENVRVSCYGAQTSNTQVKVRITTSDL